MCLACARTLPRAAVQRELEQEHPDWTLHAAASAPDGDADLDGIDLAGFVPPPCPDCGGMLKPDVVFFGENVPRERVARAYAMVDDADALLVAGSSLTVMSGLRFVRHARKRGIPVVIVNRGGTRGDELADVWVDAGCSETLTALAAALCGSGWRSPAR